MDKWMDSQLGAVASTHVGHVQCARDGHMLHGQGSALWIKCASVQLGVWMILGSQISARCTQVDSARPK